MDIVKEIWTKAESQLTDPGQFVVDVVISARKGPKKVLLILDGDQGVSIDDCANISRVLSKLLDDGGISKTIIRWKYPRRVLIIR